MQRGKKVWGTPGFDSCGFRTADDGAVAVARLQPGVVGRVRGCAAGSPWCEVRVGDLGGYLRRSEIWGVSPSEEIN